MSSTTTTAAKTAEFGVIGLGVMGQNLALNIEDHGQSVAVWNLEPEGVDRFVARNGGRQIIGTKTLPDFVNSLARPRRVLMMITAGDPVDEMLRKLAPLLASGDIVIDGGNSFFKDTQRRENEMRGQSLNFFGMGVSGGEEGARHGPSLMPGGSRDAYEHMRPTLEAIAARSDSGPCVTYVGHDGAGHFVKMVHNGIEYGDMQLIAEAYDLLHRGLGLEAAELAAIFAEWNRGALESYLIDITAQILGVTDAKTGKPLVDVVLDRAGQKGTGKWTAQTALDLAVPIPTIAAALDARILSSMKPERVEAGKQYNRAASHYAGDKSELIDDIMHAYERSAELSNLLRDAEFQRVIVAAQPGWRRVVAAGTSLGIPLPAMAASLAYFDSYTSARLPQNLTQAQRDYFGAHTYQRTDDPSGAAVHTDWQALVAKPGGKA